jgi:anthranilate/para-aminobenzoate synthase component II
VGGGGPCVCVCLKSWEVYGICLGQNVIQVYDTCTTMMVPVKLFKGGKLSQHRTMSSFIFSRIQMEFVKEMYAKLIQLYHIKSAHDMHGLHGPMTYLGKV